MPDDDHRTFDHHVHADHHHCITHSHDNHPRHHHDHNGSIHYLDPSSALLIELTPPDDTHPTRHVRHVVNGGADAAPIGCVGLDVSYRTR